jgi:hypothetical protein
MAHTRPPGYLDAHLVASPAASRGRIFLRSDNRVFAIGAGLETPGRE